MIANASAEMLPAAAPRASLIIATFDRGARLLRLLTDLAAQVPAPQTAQGGLEVIVIDDGGAESAAEALRGGEWPFSLRLIRQENAGAASARDRAARLAQGEILIIVDDDMRVPPGFLQAHLRCHVPGARRAVLGPIEPDKDAPKRGIFERYNAHRLHTFAAAAAAGRLRLRGNSLCSGNLSLRRADYLAVGGFDKSLRRSEDAELGLRLEQSGVELVFAADAPVSHDSDRPDHEWLARAHQYGRADLRIARKHEGLAHADPFRYFFTLPRLSRPLLWLSLLVPSISRLVARAALACASACARVGLHALALRGAGLAYGMEYFRGVRVEAGSRRAALAAGARFLALAAAAPEKLPGVPRRRALAVKAARDFLEDRDARRRAEEKYGYEGPRGASLSAEVVRKIGLQIAAGYRLMWLLREAHFPLLAQMVSRLLRHLYGCDIHWDAEISPGISFVHGMGIAIAGGARVGRGCILSQNVTLGAGVDPATRAPGTPRLGDFVHVGAGAFLCGPIVVGAGSKIMPNAVLMQSVPAGSLVEVPAPVIRPRALVGSAS